ncbi:hypothetical protein CspHIS471_0105700 [Cutaneotrichosporon sp. HIS471]|nr:hypothetical protein CspHIS471_0105700 [Cutaneotrichosporon sp. HIS471]
MTILHPLDIKLRPIADAQYAEFYDKHIANLPYPTEVPWDPTIRNRPTVPGGNDTLLPDCKSRDIHLTNFTIRIFYPPGPEAKDPLPTFIWYHGGGMVMGLLGADNAFCTRVATTSRCAVVAVGYRLAPEHPFPAGHNDAWDALKYIHDHADELGMDSKRLAIGGSSSGGNLAACMAQTAEQEGIPLQFIALGVPVCDNTLSVETSDSWEKLENAPGLPALKMMWYRDQYLPNRANWSNPLNSPLLATDNGDAYAERLAALGKTVVHRHYPGLPHAVQNMDGVLDAARRYNRDMCVYIAQQFGGHAADCQLEAMYPEGPEVTVPREDRSAAQPWITMTPPMRLGEAPVYRASNKTLHFVDFEAEPPLRFVQHLDEIGDAVGEPVATELSDSVSVICFRKDKPGYICAYYQGVGFLSEDGTLQKLKEIIPEAQRDVLRMNDGGIDPAGRFWITEIDIEALSLGTGKIPEGRKCLGRLWRYDPDGSLHLMDEDFACGNGVAWSPDNKTMYVNDSPRGLTYAYNFDILSGKISNKRVLIDRSVLGGEPDGMVVDVEGNLWITVWGTYCLMKYASDGTHIADIRFGAKDMACPTFGGPNNDILYLASAYDLRPTRRDSDMGGHLFKYHADVRGLPKLSFDG